MFRFLVILFCYTFLMITPLRAQLTIEELMSVPFPSGMTASYDGSHIAWVFNEKGERNIFLATGESFDEVEQITDYQGDQGIGLGSIQISRDNEWMIFVRGNDTNRRGEPANPAQLQESTAQTIYATNLSTGDSRKISEGSSPQISPDGLTVAFRNKSQIWTSSIRDTLRKAKMLFKTRGGQSSIRWSPDGSKIAFRSSRGDHAYIGVYDFASESILFGDPSVDIDSEHTWNPSGTHIAYIRRPNQKNVVPFIPRRSYHPWSIRMLDVEKMEARELWKADSGAGSVLYGSFPSGEKIRFAGEDKLIFPWEKNGWVQLYALSVEDGLIIHLTRGEGIVEDYDLTDEGTAIYYTSNVGDSHRRHIFRIDLNGSNYSQITGGKGIEWNPIVTPAGLIILRSTAQRPAWPAIVKNSRIQDLAFDLIPKLDLSDLSDPELIEITATDGMEVPATLFYPSDYNASKAYPAIIFLHGGSRRQMLQGFHYRGYYSNAYALNQYFASKGYIVMALNYRSGKGLGLNFREALEYGVTGASEVRDLIGAGEYLKNRTDVDDDRIGLWGGSYGGYLTAHGLAQRSDLFAVGVDIHGVHNWNTELPNFASWYDAVKFPDIARLAYQSSPEYYVNGWKSPVLFIHGDDDRNVPFGETVYLTELLRERGVDFEQIIFPDEVHSFLLHKHWIIAQTATFEFIHNALSKK